MTESLSQDHKIYLLRLARDAITAGVLEKSPPDIDMNALPPPLTALGACFVTLTRKGQLRGCVGSLHAEQPLALEVAQRAVHSALGDTRFNPVTSKELGLIDIEISILTDPRPFSYRTAHDLLTGLRPHIDGVVLKRGIRRATFLPQVWESLPNPEDFLDHLCYKMGVPNGEWRKGNLEVETYQVLKFTEEEFKEVLERDR